MITLLIEYRLEDFAGWKDVFDQDPMGREEHGAIGHSIHRDVDDPKRILLSLEFRTLEEATTFRTALAPVWDRSGAGQAWLLRETETATY